MFDKTFSYTFLGTPYVLISKLHFALQGLTKLLAISVLVQSYISVFLIVSYLLRPAPPMCSILVSILFVSNPAPRSMHLCIKILLKPLFSV